MSNPCSLAHIALTEPKRETSEFLVLAVAMAAGRSERALGVGLLSLRIEQIKLKAFASRHHYLFM
ncbi:hypothetical protein HI914_07521 [Erysiphe necator]|nr:hypothetical protein HI914_07521 [Erysiphe necator]